MAGRHSLTIQVDPSAPGHVAVVVTVRSDLCGLRSKRYGPAVVWKLVHGKIRSSYGSARRNSSEGLFKCTWSQPDPKLFECGPRRETGRLLLNRAFVAVTSPLCRRNFAVPCPRGALKGTAMKNLLVAAAIAASFFSCEARAQGRAGDAALGAVSGAVVLGPVGAVAGAVIGYTAGPAIAHSWGVGRSTSRSRARRVTQSDPGTQQQAATKVTSSPAANRPEMVAAGKAVPPVQGLE
jgi:hypothetical protein